MKKLLVVGVIGLFLGLACAPSINANVSRDNELVEITTEICGLGDGKHTVQLTQEDAEEVEQLIDDIKRQLDEVETREETVEIFNEAIVELDNYGLLGGLNVKQVKKLVIGRFHYFDYINKLRNNNNLPPSSNILTFVIGKTSNTLFCGPVVTIMNHFITWIKNTFYKNSYWFIYDLFPFFLWIYFVFTIIPDLLLPLPNIGLGHTICVGWISYGIISGIEKYPATGWINTIGYKGMINWTGHMYGDLSISRFIIQFPPLEWHEYPGVLGFIGLRISLDSSEDEWFYIGTALKVKIDVKL